MLYTERIRRTIDNTNELKLNNMTNLEKLFKLKQLTNDVELLEYINTLITIEIEYED